jgi:superfamily II DNA or RNA helicase
MVSSKLVVDIKRAGNLLAITPACKNLLEEHLTYTHRIYDQKYGRTKITQEKRNLFSLSDDESIMYTPAGLYKRIKRILTSLGVKITYSDLRTKSFPKPDYSKMDLSTLRYGQDKALAAVFAHDMGQIVAPTAFGKSFLIKQICKAYPDLKIVICARQRAVVGTIFDDLYPLFPKEVGKMGGGYKLERRITVCTAKSLKKLDLNKVDIFIYDEVHTAASPELAAVLSTIRNAKMFGFTASPTGRFDGGEKRIEALFGPIIFTMGYEEAKDAGNVVPIRVQFYDVPGMNQTSSTKSSIVKKRRCYWRNSLRNKMIANVVNKYPDKQILIMVETVDHAFHLKQYLPDFQVCYSNISQARRNALIRAKLLKPNEAYMTNKSLDYFRRQFEKGELKKCICTNIWGAGVNFHKLEVLVRADGASGSIPSTQIPGRLSRLSDGKECGLLIDFADRFDPWACKRAASRLKIYQSHGWEITHS